MPCFWNGLTENPAQSWPYGLCIKARFIRGYTVIPICYYEGPYVKIRDCHGSTAQQIDYTVMTLHIRKLVSVLVLCHDYGPHVKARICRGKIYSLPSHDYRDQKWRFVSVIAPQMACSVVTTHQAWRLFLTWFECFGFFVTRLAGFMSTLSRKICRIFHPSLT